LNELHRQLPKDPVSQRMVYDLELFFLTHTRIRLATYRYSLSMTREYDKQQKKQQKKVVRFNEPDYVRMSRDLESEF